MCDIRIYNVYEKSYLNASTVNIEFHPNQIIYHVWHVVDANLPEVHLCYSI